MAEVTRRSAWTRVGWFRVLGALLAAVVAGQSPCAGAPRQSEPAPQDQPASAPDGAKPARPARPPTTQELLDELQLLRGRAMPNEVNRMIEIARDAKLPIAVRSPATAYLREFTWPGSSPDIRQRVEDTLFEFAMNDAESLHLRSTALLHFLSRWIDDPAHERGAQVAALVRKADTLEPRMAKMLTELSKLLVSARVDKLDQLAEDPSPLISRPAREQAQKLRKLDKHMSYVEIVNVQTWRERRLASWQNRLREAQARKNAPAVPPPPNQPDAKTRSLMEAPDTLDIGEIRRTIREIQNMPLIDLIALEMIRYADARAGVAAGRLRAEHRVEEARIWYATYRPPITIPIFWTETSSFMTTSGRLEYETAEYGFTITFGGNIPRELRHDEVHELSLADAEHASAYRRMLDAERNLEGLSDETRKRAIARQGELLEAADRKPARKNTPGSSGPGAR